MRVAPKAVNDGLVTFFEIQVVFKPRLIEQLQSHRVNRRRLAVHIGHVQEGSPGRIEHPICALGHRLLGQYQGLTVTGEGSRLAAVDVARKLIQNNDFSQYCKRITRNIWSRNDGLQKGSSRSRG